MPKASHFASFYVAEFLILLLKLGSGWHSIGRQQTQLPPFRMMLRLIRHCFVGFTLLGILSAEAGQLELTGPAGSGSFGVIVTALPNGNFIVTDPGYDAPGGTGLRTATLGIANNDSNESPYEFAVQGIGQTEIENWRSTYFGGATENVGNLEDFDADGLNNLFEFAFGTIPSSRDSG